MRAGTRDGALHEEVFHVSVRVPPTASNEGRDEDEPLLSGRMLASVFPSKTSSGAITSQLHVMLPLLFHVPLMASVCVSRK